MYPMCGAEFAVSREESEAFARLSGDFNPLHLDPVAARRTQFGGTVNHGIHLLLAALDRTAQAWLAGHIEPATLKVVFSNPVRTGTRLRVQLEGAETESRRLVAEADGCVAFSATITFAPRADTSTHSAEDREFAREAPRNAPFPPVGVEGDVSPCLDRGLLARLFPALAAAGCGLWVAELLATTRIVGMLCPGLDSVYSTSKLSRPRSADAARAGMHYRVERIDERFRMVRIAVTGHSLEGYLEAFYRPPPVEQPSLAEIAAKVPVRLFAGERALVIGGSRGLGELTAKMLLAGGAEVVVTFAQGRVDAERVCAEARELGRSCAAEPFDVARGSQCTLPAALARMAATHVYFFASPPIGKNLAGLWDHGRFENFTHVYVDAFAVIAAALLAPDRGTRQAVRFFYPSTILLTEPEKGFAEYCAAKAAGEALCDQLALQYGARFERPRLPRLRTDQTSGIRASGARDPFPVMYEALRAFHS